MDEHAVALVAGASGLIGRAVTDELQGAAGWRSRGLASRPIAGVETITADLTDRTRTLAALAGAGDTTHVFYAAYKAQPNLTAEVETNGPMLDNLLAGLEAAGAPLRRVVLYQGAKVYGVHLGPVKAPFYEDDPRHLPPNFYYTQADLLRQRAEAGGYSWSLLRPDVVVGDVAGYPMSIATVIGVYAAICQATGTLFRFPGPEKVYDGVFAQVTDSRLLARASLWAATADAARDEAFNYVHEPFRWERIWRQVAAGLGVEVGPPMPMNLARHMADKAPVWADLARSHGLRDMPYDKLVGWAFGDFVFNAAFDVVSDMGKIRRAGFHETVESAAAILAAIRRLQDAKVLPPMRGGVFAAAGRVA